MSQWTKKAIMESFAKMIDEQPLDRITVKSIVEDCGVTRNTFYYHFEDIYALAKETLQERLQQMTADYGPNADWESFLLLIARQLTENKRTLRHLFRSSKSPELGRFLSELASVAMNHLFDYLAEGKQVAPENRQLIIDFYRFSLTGIAEHWLNNNTADTEKLVHQISLLLQGGMRQAICDAEKLKN